MEAYKEVQLKRTELDGRRPGSQPWKFRAPCEIVFLAGDVSATSVSLPAPVDTPQVSMSAFDVSSHMSLGPVFKVTTE